MMRLALWVFGFCVLMVLGVVAVLWLNSLPLNIVVVRENQPELDFELGIVALVATFLSAALVLVFGVLVSVLRLPSWVHEVRKRSRKRKGNDALASGLLAVEGGDLKGAKRLTQKALSDADDERLALLLDARTAEQEQNWTRAERAFAELSRKPGAHLAGLKGLTGVAVKRGDFAMAIERAREALNMRGETGDWPFKSLFEIHVARAEWPDARTVLATGESKGHIAADAAKRRRAVLLVAEAVDRMGTDPEAAEQLLNDALKAAPNFPPAAFFLARLQVAREAGKQAVATLETAWKAAPHPALSLLALRADESLPPSGRKATAALIQANKGHRETAILRADLAIAGGDWDAAEKALGPLVQGGQPTNRVSRLMEVITRRRGDLNVAQEWAEKAASAPREPEWSDIETDGSAFQYSQEDWSRLVYTFGDGAQLIHPRYEGYRAELDVARHRLIGGPTATTGSETPKPESSEPKTIEGPPAADYIDGR